MFLGEELVTNGGFGADSDWDKGTGWSIADGVASLADVPADGYLSQDAGIVISKDYLVVFEVKNYSKGLVFIRIGGEDGSFWSANGVYEEIISSFGADALIKFHGGFAPVALSIDNVSVKEVMPTPTSKSRGLIAAQTARAMAQKIQRAPF